jgi:hypothetical protein
MEGIVMGACINDHLNRYGGLAVGHEDEQKRYFREKRLYALQIETTDACQQGCIYCYAGSIPRERHGLTSDEIRSLLDDAAEMEIRAIDWLGGDPLLRRDLMETGLMTGEEWLALNTFMVFPYMETLDGYAALCESAGLSVVEKEDLTPDFARNVEGYLEKLQNDFRQGVVDNYGQEMYAEVERGITLWRDASAAGKVGRGRILARK